VLIQGRQRVSTGDPGLGVVVERGPGNPKLCDLNRLQVLDRERLSEGQQVVLDQVRGEVADVVSTDAFGDER